MGFDTTTLLTSVIASIAGLIIAGMFKQFLKIIRRFQDVKKWKESELNKGKVELDPERFALVSSPVFIQTMGQTEGPHDSDNIYCCPIKIGID